MSMVPQEQRAGLGVEIYGTGPKVTATFYAERGSSFTELHRIPTIDGKIENHGTTELTKGVTGPELVWRTEIASRAVIGSLLRGYVEANGWKGTPEALHRIQTLG